MRPCFAIAIVLVWTALVQAQAEWRPATSPDGILQGNVGGKKSSSVEKANTLAGKVVTNLNEFQHDNLHFALSSTRLSRLVRRLTNDDKLYSSAKKGVLTKYSGKEISYTEATVDGVPARLLRYEVEKAESGQTRSYVGTAAIFIFRNSMYAANVLCEKGGDQANVKKFLESIRVKKN